MTILINGAAGYIGSHVAEALQTKHKLVLLDNVNAYYNPEFKRTNLATLHRHPFYEIDICDSAALAKVFAEQNIDCIIHLAARAGIRPSLESPSLYTSVNVTGTTNLAQLAVQHHVKQFIFGSSSSVYGNSTALPYHEAADVNQPVSPYAATKRAAELMLYTFHELYHLPITILRFFTVYGERGRPDMAPYLFTEAILNGKPIQQFGDGSSSRDYTYIQDIVQGIVAAIEHPYPYEIINLGNSTAVPLQELIHTIEKISGKLAIIEQAHHQAGDVNHTLADITKAKQLLNYQPQTSLADGLARFIAWFQANRLSS
jgi:UDP-glucuronate 4-epimerase